MHTHMSSCTHARIHTHTHIHAYTHTRIHAYTHTRIHAYTHTRIHMRIDLETSIAYTHKHVCAHDEKYARAYIDMFHMYVDVAYDAYVVSVRRIFSYMVKAPSCVNKNV